MTPEQFFIQELTVQKPDFGSKYDPTNMNHIKILTEYQDALDNVEIKKRTTFKEFLLPVPTKNPEEKIEEKKAQIDII